MDLVLVLLCFSVYMLSFTMAQPSPGYYPSSKVTTLSFNQLFRNLWGPGHQSLSQDQTQLTIWLDRSSGSGFKSISSYRSGYFGTSMKLQPGYTAGVIAAFYLSNNEARPGFHDEIDIEFLGTTPGKPYTLQTNVYVKGSGDGNIIGREVKFHLWFDPTADYHKYAILFNPNEIIFFVDDIPIRRYPKKNDATFPTNPMWVYGSIWDASSWATEDGKYKANYQFEPFVAQYTKFAIAGCTSDASPLCQPTPSSPAGGGLNLQQLSAMRWAQSTSLIYDYCKDTRRNLSKNTECFI